MREIVAEMWTLEPRIYCITTNGMVKSSGKAVMGGGVAKEAVDRFPNCDVKLGDLIKLHGNISQIFYQDDETVLIAFPTKKHWKDKSCIELIKESSLQLKVLMDFYSYGTVYLPRPGCGLGGLNWEFVKKEIDCILDDRVVIVSK